MTPEQEIENLKKENSVMRTDINNLIQRIDRLFSLDETRGYSGSTITATGALTIQSQGRTYQINVKKL